MTSAVIELILCLFALTSCYFAVAMEMEKLSCTGEASLGGTLSRVYIAYCGLELINSGCGCVVRVAMLTQMFRIKNEWFNKRSVGSGEHNSTAVTAGSVDQLADEAYSAEYTDYRERGKRVRTLMYPFTHWFWTPWILFSFLVLINSHTLLTPWTYHREESKVLPQARYFYMAFVIMKFVQLFTQNLCALQMNHYHKKYHRRMKKRLVERYNSRLYKTVACQKTFEFEDKYNLSPLWLGLDPGIALQTPLYILCLFFGVFVAASDLLGKDLKSSTVNSL